MNLQAFAAPQKVILDTDGDADYDDIVGLMVAGTSPEVQILGVVVTGRDTERRARAVAKALAVVGRDDVGVYLGELPLSPEPSFPYMSQFPRRLHGLQPELEKWAADFTYQFPSMSGVDFYVEQIAKFPGEVSVIVTGPLSTLGRALQVADERATGAAFRHAIRQILFSGGDFGTAEYNVFTDVGAARLVFESGVPIYQFGGEGEGKAYLTYDYRQRLWRAQTPATWALQDLYRLWRAGWDPTSPFVPILYDVHPIALLIKGEGISRFEPMAVDVDAVGHLVRTQGAPNVQVRVANQGDRLAEFVIERMTATIPPAANHLRALRRIAGRDSDEISLAVDGLLRQLDSAVATDPSALAGALDSLDPKLSTLGDRAERARWHLRMAGNFLRGEPRSDPWNDPYSPRYIALTMPAYKVIGVVSKATGVLTQRKMTVVGLVVFAGLAVGVTLRRMRRAHRA